MSPNPAVYDDAAGVLLPKAFVDPDIYQLEMDRIFGHSWLFICHVDHIPNKGDFFSTYMGEDPVIAVRQKDGSVKVILNLCRHRGMKFCRADQGNAKLFLCPFHGWAYDISGDLHSVPLEKTSFGPAFRKADWGARTAPSVAIYRGMIFASWDPDMEPFEAHLGSVRPWLDAILDRRVEGSSLIGGVIKWVIPCNWKFGPEQFAWDMVHAATTHRAVQMATHGGRMTGPDRSHGGQAITDRGHASPVLFRPTADATLDRSGIEGRKTDAARLHDARAAHNPMQQDVLLQTVTIFPNFTSVSTLNFFRVWHPRGPNEVELWSFAMFDVGEDEMARERHRLANVRTSGPAGTFEQDDGENWLEIQRASSGYQASRTPLALLMGFGMTDYPIPPRYPDMVASCMVEDGARAFYRRWHEMISATEGEHA